MNKCPWGIISAAVLLSLACGEIGPAKKRQARVMPASVRSPEILSLGKFSAAEIHRYPELTCHLMAECLRTYAEEWLDGVHFTEDRTCSSDKNSWNLPFTFKRKENTMSFVFQVIHTRLEAGINGPGRDDFTSEIKILEGAHQNPFDPLTYTGTLLHSKISHIRATLAAHFTRSRTLHNFESCYHSGRFFDDSLERCSDKPLTEVKEANGEGAELQISGLSFFEASDIQKGASGTMNDLKKLYTIFFNHLLKPDVQPFPQEPGKQRFADHYARNPMKNLSDQISLYLFEYEEEKDYEISGKTINQHLLSQEDRKALSKDISNSGKDPLIAKARSMEALIRFPFGYENKGKNKRSYDVYFSFSWKIINRKWNLFDPDGFGILATKPQNDQEGSPPGIIRITDKKQKNEITEKLSGSGRFEEKDDILHPNLPDIEIYMRNWIQTSMPLVDLDPDHTKSSDNILKELGNINIGQGKFLTVGLDRMIRTNRGLSGVLSAHEVQEQCSALTMGSSKYQMAALADYEDFLMLLKSAIDQDIKSTPLLKKFLARQGSGDYKDLLRKLVPESGFHFADREGKSSTKKAGLCLKKDPSNHLTSDETMAFIALRERLKFIYSIIPGVSDQPVVRDYNIKGALIPVASEYCSDLARKERKENEERNSDGQQQSHYYQIASKEEVRKALTRIFFNQDGLFIDSPRGFEGKNLNRRLFWKLTGGASNEDDLQAEPGPDFELQNFIKSDLSDLRPGYLFYCIQKPDL